MPVSAARLAANRANASLSTGPKTEEGLAASCRNRFSHGLSGSNFQMVPWENHNDFQALCSALHAEHQPATPTETILVNRIAEHHWLRGRALVFQELCLDAELPHLSNEKQLALYLRYQTIHERAFHCCLNEFLKLKKTRLAAEVGFESQSGQPAPHHAAAVAPSPDPAPPPLSSSPVSEPPSQRSASPALGFESQNGQPAPQHAAAVAPSSDPAPPALPSPVSEPASQRSASPALGFESQNNPPALVRRGATRVSALP